jgi:hypothetical protein
MFVQSATVCVILGQIAWLEPQWSWLRPACIWLTLAVTMLSMAVYVRRAYSLLLSSEALGGTPRPAPDADADADTARESKGASA